MWRTHCIAVGSLDNSETRNSIKWKFHSHSWQRNDTLGTWEMFRGTLLKKLTRETKTRVRDLLSQGLGSGATAALSERVSPIAGFHLALPWIRENEANSVNFALSLALSRNQHFADVMCFTSRQTSFTLLKKVFPLRNTGWHYLPPLSIDLKKPPGFSPQCKKHVVCTCQGKKFYWLANPTNKQRAQSSWERPAAAIYLLERTDHYQAIKLFETRF